MKEAIQRTFATHLTRTGGDARTVGGLCVPYDRPTIVSDDGGRTSYRERFVRGAFDPKQIAEAHRIELTYRHDDTLLGRIGKATQFEDRPDGLWGMFHVREGTVGDQALALVDDGFLTGLSISALAHRSGRDGNGTIVRQRVHLEAVGLCEQPAYDDALVSVRRSRIDVERPPRPSDEQLARLAAVGIRV